MLQRIFTYARQLFDLPTHLQKMRDARRRVRHTAGVVVQSLLAMMLCRLGSLHALEQTAPARFWRKLLGGDLPSADTLGRVCQTLDLAPLRQMQRDLYTRLKRRKALPAAGHGLVAAVLDAHETHATERRCCSGCLRRTLRTRTGERVEYYHRLVHLALVFDRRRCFQLDAEPILPGEDEVAAAKRLLERVLDAYPRAFDVVVVDAFYTRGDFFAFVRARGKHVLAVLKDEGRTLLEDARALWAQARPAVWQNGRVTHHLWDDEGYTTWPQCGRRVRVVRSVETTTIKRQLTRQREEKQSEWVWVTTLPRALASTRTVVRLGHDRWGIENGSFNEMATRWHADHVYKHDGHVMLVMWLLLSVALNLFQAFYHRNLKPALRRLYDTLQIARRMLAELLATVPTLTPVAVPRSP